jgi:integrase
MTGKAKKRASWRYSSGEWGANRVRAYDRGAKGIYLEWSEPPADPALPRRKVRKALGHSDRERAKAQADQCAAILRTRQPVRPERATLASLFDNYRREVTPQKGRVTRAHDLRAMEMFARAFGASREAHTLSRREWDRYVAERASGRLAPAGIEPGKPVRPRIIEKDLRLLNAVLNWATRAGDGRGGVLLERNPLKGLPVPREASPVRAVLSDQQFTALRAAAARASSRWELFVVLAAKTGHRAASIRQLRWSDVDLERRRIRWRGEADKSRREHTTPLTEEAAELLRREQTRTRVIGDAWVFPAARDASRCLSSNAVANQFKRLAARAGIPRGQRFGWHSFRRRFATSLRDIPLRDVCDLGGWQSPAVVLACYQQSDEASQRDALAHRRAVPGSLVAGAR